MKYRILGRTGLKVSEIGFGAWGIGGHLWADSEDKASLAALEKAIACGLDFIDTALAYGDGHSEQLISKILKKHPKLIVATKVPPMNYVWPAQPGVPIAKVFPRDYIISCTEKSLKNLKVEKLDVQQLHVWSPEWIDNDDWREACARLKKEGKIGAFGLSINDHQPDSAMAAVRTGLIDTVQVIYNIFDQSPADGLLELCEEKNVGVIARVPFDEGSLAGAIRPDTKFAKGDFRNHYFNGDRKQQVVDRIGKIQAILPGHAGSLPEAALRFCISHPAVSTVIPGMRSARHAEDNCAASDKGPLDPAFLHRLGEHRWQRNFYA